MISYEDINNECLKLIIWVMVKLILCLGLVLFVIFLYWFILG